MLYEYSYIIKHPVHNLNLYLNDFFYQIRDIEKNEKFSLEKYLDINFPKRSNKELKNKFENFFNSFKIISNEDQGKFMLLVERADFIDSYFENINHSCEEFQSVNINALLGNDSLKELMIFLYSEVFVTDRKNLLDHYLKIYESMPQKICPFCGVERMHKMSKEDYDHLAPKAKYPLFALNLKNMAPMCHICNSKFKNQIDIFYKNNVRRPFLYPYTNKIKIDLDFSGSIIDQTDPTNYHGTWSIKILPENPMTTTWDDIFNIKERYKKEYLDEDFNNWIDDFLESLKRDNVKINGIDDLVLQFSVMAESLSMKLLCNCNIIKAPLFRFLANGELVDFYESILEKLKNSIAA